MTKTVLCPRNGGLPPVVLTPDQARARAQLALYRAGLWVPVNVHAANILATM